jgi:hypothetical protein
MSMRRAVRPAGKVTDKLRSTWSLLPFPKNPALASRANISRYHPVQTGPDASICPRESRCEPTTCRAGKGANGLGESHTARFLAGVSIGWLNI